MRAHDQRPPASPKGTIHRQAHHLRIVDMEQIIVLDQTAKRGSQTDQSMAMKRNAKDGTRIETIRGKLPVGCVDLGEIAHPVSANQGLGERADNILDAANRWCVNRGDLKKAHEIYAQMFSPAL